MVLTRNAQQQQQQAPPAAPGGGRRSGTTNYSTQETIDLMYAILARLPIGSDQWNEVEATRAQTILMPKEMSSPSIGSMHLFIGKTYLLEIITVLW